MGVKNYKAFIDALANVGWNPSPNWVQINTVTPMNNSILACYALWIFYIFFFLATLVCVSLHLNLKIDGRIQPPILLNICRTRTFDLIDQLIQKCKCKRTHSKERAHCDVWEVRVGSIPSTLRHAFLPEFVQFIL